MSPSDCVRRRPKKVLSHRTLEYWIITPGSDGKNNGGNRAQIGWNQRCSLSQCGIWIGGFCQMAEPRRLGWAVGESGNKKFESSSGMLASGVCRMVPSQWRTCEFSDTLWLGPSLFITHSVVLKIEWLGRSRSDTASSRPVGSSGGPEPEFAGHRHGGDSETNYQKSQAALARQRTARDRSGSGWPQLPRIYSSHLDPPRSALTKPHEEDVFVPSAARDEPS
ncbi:hypothetical protein PGTUg99_015790 [Puccinia graminis f. sp. tritici]|uniref:Uncharacterized protein n=1 Tax=Puccinia graminis f. sp. tritici TaxID=56615 RepID=A0A5B0SK45_PUCGR|nr:hypothetical protein PGTUg99_015790 [Puccinia graminis f. sp. tritici]